MPFVKSFLVTAALLLSAFLGLGLYLQSLEGDLTRLANLAERSWGWNAPQPPLDVLENRTDLPPSVIVIGDSFSAGNDWQSVAQQASGRRFTTFHWHDIGAPTCLAHAVEVLHQRYPGARDVVVQTVERAFMDRFGGAPANPAGCDERLASSVRNEAGPAPTVRARFDLARPMPDPLYALRALAAERAPREQDGRAGDVVFSRLSRADLFSSRHPDVLLTFADDLAKADWTASQLDAAVDRAKSVAARAQVLGLRLTYVVVPDKSTVYAPWLVRAPARQAPRVWPLLEAAGIRSVDLQAAFAAEAGRSADFYLPNNTHVGNRGYLVLGRAVADCLEGASPEGERVADALAQRGSGRPSASCLRTSAT